MVDHSIHFDTQSDPVMVPTGTLLVEAARKAAIDLQQPCGGQGRCGRCVVKVNNGHIRSRSTLRLSNEDIEAGYVLACQSVVEGNAEIIIPPQEEIVRHLTTDRTATKVSVPAGYNPATGQSICRVSLTLPPPSMEDQTDDWSRLQRALRKQTETENVQISLGMLRQLGQSLREGDWTITLVLDSQYWDCPECPTRIVDLIPGIVPEDAPLWGIAVDIGTTTVTVWLVDLLTGEVKTQVSEYNQQIKRGEDVISRIIYADKKDGGDEMSRLVLDTIDTLVQRACKRVRAIPQDIVKATIGGNSTMLHLLLGISASSIRLSPFVTAINHIPTLQAKDVGLEIHPGATVDCLPGVASYVGADITAGVLSTGVDDTDKVTLFLDVGTNGESVLGTRDWLVTVACSAGPAFEGAGVVDGMRATKGAIEEVWIDSNTYETNYRVIGNTKPKGLCGSGLISLLAEMFLTGVLDKSGNIILTLDTPRVREGEHKGEYVIAWANETSHGQDIVITHVDVDNLIRAKAAIYAGFSVMAERVGIPMEMIEQVFIGGSFGQYINIEKAIEIGLLPDMDWENFHFLGNTSVQGAYLALIDQKMRSRINDIASKMTYIELSADNSFYEAFTSALFLPHTDMQLFPTVAKHFQSKPVKVKKP